VRVFLSRLRVWITPASRSPRATTRGPSGPARLSKCGWDALGDVQTVEAGERAGLRLAYVRGPDGVLIAILDE